jgi:glutamate-5-semialdehyde dehydrogenase
VDDGILRKAQDALSAAPPIGDPVYREFPTVLAGQLADHWPRIEQANRIDIDALNRRGGSRALLRRLSLDGSQLSQLVALTGMVTRELAGQKPLGQVWSDSSALTVRRILRPLGVIFMIYEGRPTVTVEGVLLPVVMGNSVILRGGNEIASTNTALGFAIDSALEKCGLPAGMAQVIEDGDRSKLRALIRADGQIDVVIARGSPSLLDYCRRVSAIPVIASGGGVNHLYVHRSADLDLAADCVLDSKLVDPAGCTAVEMILADDSVAGDLISALAGRAARSPGHAFTLCLPPNLARRLPADSGIGARALTETDSGREFLDDTIALRPVSGLAEAADHIRSYGSGHTEGIVASEPEIVAEFFRLVDAAALIVNGSLRLHDGPAMGLGAELAISTGRLHRRGPLTLDSLTTYSWIVTAHNDSHQEDIH